MPRVCGEASTAPATLYIIWGLPPRVRGSLSFCTEPIQPSGSTPACAGQPMRLPSARRRGTVYPRVCGEAGTLRPMPLGQVFLGLLVCGEAVYPRVCGEADRNCKNGCVHYGLPPRVRGSRPLRTMKSSSHRSTPACAGKPAVLNGMHRIKEVYPRVCGEARGIHQASVHILDGGLPPRVRGSLKRQQVESNQHRSTPACAGKPSGDLSGLFGLPPRVRGSLYLH